MKHGFIGLFCLVAAFITACGSATGARCKDDRDCPRDGYCCEGKACGPGMCTFKCKSDRDCPADAACDGGKCYEACNSDRQCAFDMSCEHDRVCQY